MSTPDSKSHRKHLRKTMRRPDGRRRAPGYILEDGTSRTRRRIRRNARRALRLVMPPLPQSAAHLYAAVRRLARNG